MTVQSTEPKIDKPCRLDRNADTSETPDGLEPGGKSPEGLEKSSNHQSGWIGGLTGPSPCGNETAEQSC